MQGDRLKILVDIAHYNGAVLAQCHGLPFVQLALYPGAEAVIVGLLHINLVLLDLIAVDQRIFMDRVDKAHAEPVSLVQAVADAGLTVFPAAQGEIPARPHADCC